MTDEKTIKVFEDEGKDETVIEEQETVEAEEALIVNIDNMDRIGETGRGVIQLNKPVTNEDGSRTTTLAFDFSSISWLTYNKVVKSVEKEKKVRFSPTEAYQDRDVLINLLAEATGILKPELAARYSAKDISRGCEMGALFFAK